MFELYNNVLNTTDLNIIKHCLFFKGFHLVLLGIMCPDCKPFAS